MLENFRETIRNDIEELAATGAMTEAIRISAATGQRFDHDAYPLYFTGKLDAKMVLVHLNPRPTTNYSDECKRRPGLRSVDGYFEYHEHFGMYTYGKASARTHRSRFDHKQILFLKEFGAINFVEEEGTEDRFTNLERAIDAKLQLELIPYSSNSFSRKGFTSKILQPHIDRTLGVLTSTPRDYIIFCGVIFEDFFRNAVIDSRTFKLKKKDGGFSKGSARFSNLRFGHNGKVIRAGLAHTFAQQGISMCAYGRQCKELYDDGCRS
jgi:hypothetical protein